jgi:acyl transferase domain-containing protein/acyl carrier protein
VSGTDPGQGGGAPADPRCGGPLAIVGLGALFPRAEGLEAYWRNCREGVDCITEIPASHWRPEDYFDADPKSPDMTYARRGGFLPPVRLNPMELGVSPNALEATDSAQLLGLEVARRALEDAGYGPAGRAFDRDRASVVLGVTGTLQLVIPLGARLGHPLWRKALREAGVDDARAEDAVRRIADGYVPWKEDSFPGLLGNVVAGRIANRLDLHGTNCVVDAACASSLSALHLAFLELAAGRSDLVVTGGVDTFNDIFMYMCFSKTPALSPTGDARPFDAAADGTVLGEGIGMMVVKRLADAERDGDRVYALVRGIGSSSDGKGDAIYAPTKEGQVRALRSAYRAAGVSPATVGLLEGHGTGTKVGDAVEVAALEEVFREARPEGTWCALGSVKSQVGHTKAAAGSAGLLKAALALHHKVLPPTLKVTRPLERLAGGTTPFYLDTAKRPWLPPRGHPRRAGVSSFGFGGSNFHCVLEEHGTLRAAPDWDGDVQVVPFAADSREGIAAALAGWPRDLPWADLRSRAAAARKGFEPARRCRLVLCVERGRSDLAKLLDGARSLLERPGGRPSWSTPDGAHYAEGPAPGRLGVLFPGQGSQYTGMLRDLSCRFPEMLDALAEADELFAGDAGPGAGPRLSDLVYPPASFAAGGRERQEEALRATQAAQPAIGAVSLGALRVLEGFGVSPDAVAGHSYGELLALCAAGRFDGRALHRLSGLRGRLMADGRVDQGAMLAVQAPLDSVERVLREDRLDLVVANRNAPNQAVVSGATVEIERAAASFATREIRSRRLPVAAAFHSPLVAHARDPMRAALGETEFLPPRIPVYADGTAEVYPADPDAAREVLASQLAMPVEFVRIVENMHAAGVRTFFEVGPGARLGSLIGAILQDRPHEVFSLDASSGNRSGMADLGSALARLAALGHRVDLGRWDPAAALPTPAGAKPAFTVELSGVNYRSPRKTPAAAAAAPPPPSRPAAAAAEGTAPGMRFASENLEALLRVQAETAAMHRLYLEGQDRIREALMGIVPASAVPVGTPVQGPQTPAIPPIPAVPPAAPSAAPDAVAAALLDAVAEKTGYPVEMLNLDMGMDADLGIDSIKRVEILSSLQERMPGLPSVKPDRMGSFRTLRDVVAFLQGAAPGGAAVAASAPVGGAPAVDRAPAPAAVPPLPLRAAPSAEIAKVLLQAVADRTGYPVEKLGLEMSLDADLGIDSIKRVEILSAVQERFPDLAVVKPDQLGKFRSLKEIVEHLEGGGAGRGREVVAGPAGLDRESHGNRGQSLPRSDGVLRPATPDRGVGQSPLGPTMVSTPSDLEGGGQSPPGRDVVVVPLQRLLLRAVPWTPPAVREPIPVPAGAEVWVTDSGDGFAAAVAAALGARGLAARVVPPAGAEGVPERLGGLVLVAPRAAGDAGVRDAFAAAVRAGPALRRAARDGGAFLATVSRMDGAFGLATGEDPVAAAWAGLLKTAAREWPEVAARALDVEPAAADAEPAARAVAAEVLARGPVETGIAADGLRTLVTVEAPLPMVGPAAGPGESFPVGEGEVVVVSGGARGVTAACAVAIARRARPAFLLLGRSPVPGPEAEDLRGLETEAGVKRALLARAPGRASPRELESAWREVDAAREIRATLAALEAAGSRVLYRSVDVRDHSAVRAALEEARRVLGPVAGIVHGAGVLADARLEEKTPEQVERVLGPKVEGLRALLEAAAGDELKLLAVFSSSTGRFGRTGQADYAAANEAAARMARREARSRPRCRVLAMDWGPWEGGMVTPALARVFEREGVGLIPLAAGAEHLLREIAAARPGEPVEAVVLGPGPAGAAAAPPPPAPALARAFDIEVDPARHRYLRSHEIDGRPVVPAALLVEWLAHGALHGNPGLVFHGMEEFRVLRGVTLEGGRPETVRILAGRAERRGDLRAVAVELRGSAGGRDLLHARGTAILATALPPGPAAGPLPSVPASALDPEAAYRDLLFHGPDLHALAAVEGVGPAGAVVRAKAAPPPREWIAGPLRGAWIADPFALDAVFQAAILWAWEAHGAPALPTGFAGFLQHRRAFPRDGVRVALRLRKDREHAAVFDAEFTDSAGALVARMEGFECVIDASLRGAFRRRGPG